MGGMQLYRLVMYKFFSSLEVSFDESNLSYQKSNSNTELSEVFEIKSECPSFWKFQI